MAKSSGSNRLTLVITLTLVLVAALGLCRYSPFCEASPTESASLLIVAHEDFLDELQPLVEWKDRTGMPTVLVSWQSLDTTYSGYDEPERIKRGIADFQQRYGIKYVMLVGDCHNFPVRYQMNAGPCYVEVQGAAPRMVSLGTYLACDLYYADLYDESGNFNAWDFDGNHYFGELYGEYYHEPINHDRINMIPDVAVGRAPASDEAEVTNYVNKVIHYESTGITETWISNILFAVTNQSFPSEIEAKEDIIEGYSGVTFLENKPAPTFWRMYIPEVEDEAGVATDYVPSAGNMISLMNNPGLGLINFGGHGGQSNEVTDWDYHCVMEWGIGTWDLPLLTTQRYPIVFACGCGNGRFTVEPPHDPYICVGGVTHPGWGLGEIFSTTAYPPSPDPLQPRIPPGCAGEIDSFGEYGLCRTDCAGSDIRNRGFIAFIGCVTGAQDAIGELDEWFLKSFFSWSGTEKRLGDLWNSAIEYYCDDHGYGRGEHSKTAEWWYDIAKYQMPIKVCLFGDPSLRVGGLPHHPPSLQPLSPPTPFPEGTTVDFSSYVSFYDPEGSPPQYRVDWNGDGSWDTGWVSSPRYTYWDDFTSIVKIQASDGEYYSEPVGFSINIYNVPPSPEIETPVVKIYYDYGYRYRFLAGDPGHDTFTYTVDFGDGSDEIVETTSDGSIQIDHTYDRMGEYTIRVTLADDDGGEGSASVTVQVVMADPATETARRIVERLGGGRPEVGFLIFGIMITAPAMFSVTAWIKIPKWWRGCPMGARVLISLLPTLTVIGLLILLRIIPILELLGFP